MIEENLEGQKGTAYFNIPLFLSNSKHFMSWIRSPEYAVWFILYGHVADQSSSLGLDKELYNTFYKEGKLVVSKELKWLADFLDVSGPGYIGKIINRMVGKGIVKEHKVKWKGRSRKVYELGYLSEGIYKHENLYMIHHFVNLYSGE